MAFSSLNVFQMIVLLLPLFELGVMSSTATAQTTHKQVSESATVTSAVQYLDDLKECVAGSQNPPMPMPFLEGALAVSQIVGWEDETCVVETIVFLAQEPETQTTMSYCQHAPATIARMTDDVAYEQARTGNYSFSKESDRDMALSTALETECELNFEWFEELSSPAL